MKHLSNILVGLTFTAVGLAACADKPTSGRTDTYSSGAITFASDESFSPIIEEERQVFEASYPQAKVTPLYINEIDGMNKLLKDSSICLLITSRNYTAKEKQYLKDSKFLPVSIPIAYDGLALIINNQNQDSCIAAKDVKAILRGEIKKWNQLNPKSTLGDIQVVFDNKKSSTIQYCVDSLLNGQHITSDNIQAVNKSKDVIDYVQKTPNAIGIIGSNWLNDQRDSTNTTFKKNIRVMSVSKLDKATDMNSWKPYQAYLYDGRYPFIRTIYALLNDPINGLPWGFAHFLESPKGQLIIFKSGLLPYRGDINVRSVNVDDE